MITKTGDPEIAIKINNPGAFHWGVKDLEAEKAKEAEKNKKTQKSKKAEKNAKDPKALENSTPSE
jgi:hypothetical protein